MYKTTPNYLPPPHAALPQKASFYSNVDVSSFFGSLTLGVANYAHVLIFYDSLTWVYTVRHFNRNHNCPSKGKLNSTINVLLLWLFLEEVESQNVTKTETYVNLIFSNTLLSDHDSTRKPDTWSYILEINLLAIRKQMEK